jgi:chromosome segregation ATPase
LVRCIYAALLFVTQVERLVEERKVLQQELQASKQETAEAEGSTAALKEELSAMQAELARQAGEAAQQQERSNLKLETEGRLRLDLQHELARCVCVRVISRIRPV